MVTAQDQQRALTAAKLRSAVVAPLHAAASLLDGEVSRGDPETSAAVAVALGQIRATTADVEDLVHGAGAVGLGQGRLVDAVRAMARR